MIDIIAGARPNFMKVAPIIRAIEAMPAPRLAYRLVHTGQHYDSRMSADFFEQLAIPEPHVNLEVGSGTQAEQTAAIILRYEALLERDRPDLCLVVGDVTSTMACAIVARKAGVPVAHVEAGLRSHDWSMPEEINRVVTDAVASWFFTTSDSASRNLINAGARPEEVFFVGNTMIDTLLANLGRLRPPAFWGEMRLEPGKYFVLTLHRPSNVDDPSRLASLLDAIALGCRDHPVVFPMHPRTATSSAGGPAQRANLKVVPPQGYLEFNYLVRHAKAVVTDSGGITEETTIMSVPCLTLRDSTERPETVTIGTNELIGTDPAALSPALDRVFAGTWKSGRIPEKWDGRAAERIVAALAHLAR
jgi:UDP-N-acetylglucosamine 2-epimerase (non-hydrolysing)